MYDLDTYQKAKDIVEILIKNGKKLSIAESCTGGLLSAAITSVSGSSNIFELSVVTYSNNAKKKLLKVKTGTLSKYGEVSKETAIDMCKGLTQLACSDYCVSVTGIAGPSGGTETKPVGLVYIAVSSKEKAISCKKYEFIGDRNTVRNLAVYEALCLLENYISF